MSPATEYMLNTSLTLAGILVLAWVLVYASRRWERAAPRGPLELLGTLRLESKRAVYLVRVGERVVALGATEGGMVKVMEVAPSEVAGAPRPVEGFSALLHRLERAPANAASNAGHADAPGGTVVNSEPQDHAR